MQDEILKVQIRDAILPPNEKFRFTGGVGLFRNAEIQIAGNTDPMVERLLALIKSLAPS